MESKENFGDEDIEYENKHINERNEERNEKRSEKRDEKRKNKIDCDNNDDNDIITSILSRLNVVESHAKRTRYSKPKNS